MKKRGFKYKSLRKNLGLAVAEVAEELDITPRQLYDFESNVLLNPLVELKIWGLVDNHYREIKRKINTQELKGFQPEELLSRDHIPKGFRFKIGDSVIRPDNGVNLGKVVAITKNLFLKTCLKCSESGSITTLYHPDYYKPTGEKLLSDYLK